MIYDKNIPDFALKPAMEPEKADDGFDPSPYDRILNVRPKLEEILNSEAPETSAAETPEVDTAEAPEKIEAVEAEETVAITEVEEETPEAFAEPVISEPTPIVSESQPSQPPPQPSPQIQTPAPTKKEPAKIIPLTGSVLCSNLKITDIKEPPRTRIFIEEDILVPDIKPDLKSILSMDGMSRLSGKEILVGANGEDTLKVIGEITLQTIYIPDKAAESQEQIITIQSRIPFKSDWGVSVSPLSHVAVKPIIENIDYTVINERKIRAKIAMFLTLREYSDINIEIFEEIRGEDLQLLKEKIRLTDVAVRKTDVMELNESLPFKDSTLLPHKILKYNINIVENHKQIAGEKAVINAAVYCNVLYLSEQEYPEEIDVSADSAEASAANVIRRTEPCIFQGRTEFTQFIPFSGAGNPAGSRATFNGSDLTLRIKEEDGKPIGFILEGNVETSLELYRNVEKEIVTDLYHNAKDISYDYSEIGAIALCGGGVSEISVREILNVPERYSEAEKVIYISARIKDSSSTMEQGKNIIEGVAEVTVLLMSADENRTPFKITQEIPFRSSMEIPGIKQGMTADNEIAIKDLWFDKLNSKQIEVNAGIFISSTVSSHETHRLIKNVCFVEKTDAMERMPSMIVYITRKGDNLWKIAKKYRTTVDTIKSVNNLEQGGQLPPGAKLLIVK